MPAQSLRHVKFLSIVLAMFLANFLAVDSGALPCQSTHCHAAEYDLPQARVEDLVSIAADYGSRWNEGVYEVWLLEGNCLINQGLTYARAKQCVVWIRRGGVNGAGGTSAGDPPSKVIAFLEGDVTIDYQQGGSGVIRGSQPITARIKDKQWFGRFYSNKAISVRATHELPEPTVKPLVYEHARAARDPNAAPTGVAADSAKALAAKGATASGSVQQAQFAEPNAPAVSPNVPPAGARRIRAFPRSGVPFQAQGFSNATTDETTVIVSSGVNLIVDGVQGLGSIDVQTDRLVIWTTGGLSLDQTGQSVQSENRPLEIYMEGNIVFRQGDRVMEANRMYYDVRLQRGTVLDAEIRTPVPQYEGLVKLKAQVLQQVDKDNFIARDASITSSRFGVPGYDLRAGALTYSDRETPRINPVTGVAEVNPVTGEPIIGHAQMATASNNFVYIEDVPVFYFPRIATDLKKPNYYINDARFKQDRIFGTQLLFDFDTFQVLGLDQPDGVQWEFSTDIYSKRGLAVGTAFEYDRNDGLFGFPGRYLGLIDAYGLHDDGLDTLGRDRKNMVPERDWRGRLFARHRQYFDNNVQLTGELGLISDRNFTEQYFEKEWDQNKDQTTGLELKQYIDNMTLSFQGDLRPNNFFTDTEQARIDQYWLGQSILDDTLTYSSHSSLGYAGLRIVSTPTAPADAAKFGLLPWERSTDGGKYFTTQGIEAPFAAGPVKLVPYALGQAAHWDETLDGSANDRLYGQIGVRGSLPFWTSDATVESTLLNLHGVAHKVTLDADFSYSDANRNVTEFPLYDPLDDNNIEHFRRRFPFDDFGTPPPVPFQLDERSYAVRRNLMGNITNPSAEIAEDLLVGRFDLHQRWQTKRGAPGNRRIIDYVKFDVGASVFPYANRDNFGQTVGLVDYNFQWAVGDRLTVVSDGTFDFFTNGGKYAQVGGFLTRPPRGSFYLGLSTYDGPFSYTVLSTAFSYRMSPKWISTFGTTFALNNGGNIGQNFSLTRIGESFLMSLGFNVDASKGNVGAQLMIEPRFFPRGPFGPAGGVVIPPSGAFGLE